ncbi:MAG: transcription-repair coupling factor [Candidatus Latescibacterota bacterium]|nr:MAG: transcription-repair coupling factor [Candidatus Latescibacterota bacterium]
MWDDVKRALAALPQYKAVLAAAGREAGSVRVAGLYGSARALFLARLAEDLRAPLLVVAPDPVRARDVEDDLRIFGMDGVVAYPEDEILPYDYHDPDRNLTGMQMLALDALGAGRVQALVCTLRGALKKVYSPTLFRSLVVEIRAGEERDPTDLAEILVRLGYERHETVEAKGMFAVRGGIFDLFAVAEDEPVRMEFDGDTIVSMRAFDIETQRSTGAREALRAHPPSHIYLDPDGVARLAARLRGSGGTLAGEERETRLVAAERLEKGISFFGMEHYAAAVHEVVPLFDHFAAPPVVALVDAEDIETSLGEFRGEIVERYERSGEEGNLYPAPAEVYVGEEALAERLAAARRVSIHALEWEGAVRFGTSSPGDYRRNLAGLVSDVEKEVRKGSSVYFFCANRPQRDRAEELLEDVAMEIDFPLGELSSGFRWPELGVFFLSEAEVFGRYHRPYHTKPARSRSLAYDPSHFHAGDFIVHVNHGIGRYMGMRVIDVEGGRTECLDLRYGGDDHLFIPVAQLRMVEKYTGGEGDEPELARLGSAAWTRTRERARKSAEKIARDLLEVYAARQLAKGFAYPPDRAWQKEMEASFPYEETEHQLRATAEVKNDMESQRPMDRLLCGDVGFGKTEVAVRAAFKAALSGKQVAILVPTTILAMQHYATVSERLQGYPVTVAMLSRFVTPAHQKKVVADAAGGRVDVVVGTHRLLSGDILFRDLGLVVVDEEHRFGVRHKDRFRAIKKSVDVLSMTATPIPRTLSMALSGIRDFSVIDTPPRNRLPIHTEILPFDDDRIRDAVMREVDRGGQVFFVHNRVQSIAVMEGYLRRLLPERVRISSAHGQMHERELERRMIDFLERRFDVLVCTMIIEAGLDFPNVNTIVINRADRFGLAQIYQLRGRVGRSDRKAYAYLLVPKGKTLTPQAVKRLQAISEFDYLGAGYRIAMRDLEIRGAGNLLGVEQSGHVAAVGLDLYTRMLREEVARLRGEPVPEEREIRMSVPVPAYLPSEYVLDSEERMDIYRRVSRIGSAAEAEEMRNELRDRFGPPPAPAVNMLRLVEIKARAAAAGIERIEIARAGTLNAGFAAARAPDRGKIAEIVELFAGRLAFSTKEGFGMTVRPAKGESGGVSGEPAGRSPDRGATREPAGGSAIESRLADLENLLKSLESSAKLNS